MKWPGMPQKLQMLLLDTFVPTKAVPAGLGLLNPTCCACVCRRFLMVSERLVMAEVRVSSFAWVASATGGDGDEVTATGENVAGPYPCVGAIKAEAVPIRT